MNDNRDYDKIYKRLEYVFNNEILDRCCISVFAPKNPGKVIEEVKPTDQAGLRRWYTDAEWIHKRTLERIDNTYYAGDALPIIFPYIGTGGHAKYLAPKEAVEYSPDTVWIHPVIQDLSNFNYDFDPATNEVFKEECEILSYLAKEANDRYLVAMPDNCGSYDALSQLRGAEEMLIDFITEPEALKNAGRKIVDMLIKSSDIMFDIIKGTARGGSVQGWMNTVSKGKHLQLQCDLSVMISKDTFDEFIAEELITTSKWLDNAIYHFDGVEQIRHLDTLLSIDSIDMIQWTQVAGQAPVTDYIPELKRIQNAGKGLVLMVSPSQAVELLDNLKPNGLNIITNTATPEEADDLVKLVSKY